MHASCTKCSVGYVPSQISMLRNWAFTEKGIITSSKGNVTLRVEGCPREQFNGDYVQD